MTDLIPLVKASKKPASKKPASGAGKPQNTGSHVYMPAPGGLGKQVKEGDVTEFHHPKHGRKHRGRVTAVGEDGYRARIADGSAVDVPHTHHLATLPTGDFGTEQGLSPQDAKEAFLGPTREGGLPATDLQVAILDVMAQHGFPIDEDSITKINYDDAQKIISKFVMDDQSGERTRGPQSEDMQPGGTEAMDGTNTPPAPSGGQPGAPRSEEEAQGQQEAENMSPDDGEPPDPEGQEDDTPGNDSSPTPDLGQPPPQQEDDEDEAKDGQDARGPEGEEGGPQAEGEADEEVDPKVLAAIQALIMALEHSSEAVGKKKEGPITGKKGSGKPRKV